jgi:1-phosphatidylinositol phosphodiesterase
VGGDTTFTGSGGAINEALAEFNRFLDKYPTETIIIRLVNVGMGGGSHHLNATLDQWRHHIDIVFRQSAVKDELWVAPSGESPQAATLGEVRKKVVVLRDGLGNAGATLDTYGMDMSTIYPDWLPPARFASIGSLYGRWNDAKSRLREVANLKEGQGAITYLTGYGGAYPYFVASGYDSINGEPLTTGRTTSLPNIYPDFTTGACSLPNGKGICSVYYTGLNFMLTDSLTGMNSNSKAGSNESEIKSLGFLGMVMLDFPGQSLIKAIRGKNPKL